MLIASSTSVRARRTSGSAFVAVIKVVPYSTSPFAAISSRSARSAAPVSDRFPRACLNSFVLAAWSFPLLVDPVSAVTTASFALIPAWIASPAAGVYRFAARFDSAEASYSSAFLR
jgi:hypothetical protein